MFLRTTRVLVEVLVASLVGVALISAAAAWRLSKGPLPVEFLTRDLEAALNGRSGPVQFKLGHTLLAWAGWDRALDVRAVDVVISGENGAVIARVPEMSVSFSALALLRGIIAPTSLDIIRPRVVIVREETGRLAIAFEQADAAQGDLSDAVAAFMNRRPRNEGGLSSLRRISVLDARVTFDDRYTGVVWRALDSNIVLLRDNREVQASIAVRLGEEEGGAVLTGGASWHQGQQYVDLDAHITGLRIDRVAARLPGAGAARSIGLTFDGRISGKLGLHGEIQSARFALLSHDGVVGIEKYWPGGLPVRRVAVNGRFESEPDFLNIESFDVDLGGPVLTGRLVAVNAGGDVEIEGSSELQGGVAIDALRDLWPVGVAAPARKWVVDHLSDGRVADMRVGFSLHVPGGDVDRANLDSLSGQLSIDRTTVRYLDGMPPVRQVSGSAVFTPNRFVVTLREGDAEGLRVQSGAVRLTGLGDGAERAEIDLRIRGSLPATLALIDRPRLGFAGKVGINPQSIKGWAVTDLSLRFPLVNTLRLGDLEVTARARVGNVELPRAARGQDLSDGRFTLTVNRTKLALNGTGTLGGVPAKLSWMENFQSREQVARQYSVGAVLDDAARARFGIPAAGYVAGPVALDLAVSEARDGVARIDAKLGLKDSVVTVPGLRWQKSAGAVGVAWLSVDAVPGKPLAVREFNLRTADLNAAGAIGFDNDNRIATARLAPFRLGETNLSAILARRADGGFDISLQGPGLDIRPYIDSVAESDASLDLPALSLQGKVDQLWFGDGQPLRDVSGEAVFDGTHLVSAALSTEVEPGRRAALTLGPSNGRRRLALTTDAGGETLRALGLFANLRGGKLRLQASRPLGGAEAAWGGTFSLDEFAIVGAPVLGRMLSLASLKNVGSTLANRGVRFARLEIPFTFRGGRIDVRNARAVGSELGLTGNGVVDLKGDTIELGGTIVPAYTINSVLGNIPLLGRLLTGDKGSGVFAATYKVDGTLEDPKVSVNTLAALAPGFLRNLVGIIDGSKKLKIDPRQDMPESE